MPPSLALLLWLVLLLALFRFDPAKDPKASAVLWVPVIWMFIVGSRLPSQWLGGQVGGAAQALEEGNPLDRSIYFALILLAIGILMSRSFNWGGFFARNVALMAFLFFALLSVMWSDFPFITFKRWFRDLGNYLVILVAVVRSSVPLEAVRYAASPPWLSADPSFRFTRQVLPPARQTLRFLDVAPPST